MSTAIPVASRLLAASRVKCVTAFRVSRELLSYKGELNESIPIFICLYRAERHSASARHEDPDELALAGLDDIAIL